MARNKTNKSKSTNDKIANVQDLIENKKKELKQLNEELEVLFLQKKEEDKEEIYQKMLSNGLSVDKLLDLIAK